MAIVKHVLDSATFIASPNCDARPDPEDISLVVLHCISLPPGEFGQDFITALFCNQLDPSVHPYFADIYQLQVSAHLLVRRDGSVVQYVPFDQRAWHAGVSSYQGRDRCNEFSIGIELEGIEHIPYTEAQYTQLAEILPQLFACYPKLSAQTLTSHSAIAPTRKTDPGPLFDWDKLFMLLQNT